MRQTNEKPQKNQEKIDAETLKQMVIAAACWLNEHQAAIDALNVFPVPDGDTGTNMYLTLLDAAKEVQKIEEDDLTKVMEALATGSLMGARGNSGVILSQLFRGFATSAKGKTEMGPVELAKALKEAAAKAYKAVMKPVEGTILTVAREAGDAAEKAAISGSSVVGVLETALAQAKLTLAQTPEMLSVLKEANVVDAGGKGLCYIMEGYLRVLKGESVEDSDFQPMETDLVTVVEEEPLEFQYCTEFLIKGKDIKLDEIRDELENYGDSLLVVGSTDVTKVHLHTNNPGLVLEYAIKFGRLSKIKIDNMQEQREEKRHSTVEDDIVVEKAETKKEFGVVAVVAGEGLGEIFTSLGTDRLVTGGQTMNPSTQDLAEACEEIDSDRIIILPNNKNVIGAAEQVKEVSSKEIFIVPSQSIPQGVGALMRISVEEDFQQMYDNMKEGIEEIKTGEVTFAVRDSKINSLEINEGDIIGLFDGEIKVVDNDINKVAVEILELMVQEEDFLITIYRGQDVSEEKGDELRETIADKFTSCDVEMYPGDQPLYYYIFSVE